jgi:hypothetical protein
VRDIFFQKKNVNNLFCFRILAFYRVPPTVGREVNLTGEIKMLAEPKLRRTFFISPGNVCIVFIYMISFFS